MKRISYFDKYTEKYTFLDLESGQGTDDPAATTLPDIEGMPSQQFGVSPDGKYAYLCAFHYTLRDDMARKIRRRFFQKNNETGEMREMFTKWDRSAFQPNNYFFWTPNLLFMIACMTETGENCAYFVNIAEDFDGAHPIELWRTKAYPYSFHISPDRTRLAYHLAGHDDDFNPHGHYAINIMEMDGTRHLVCSEKGHLFFGPTWSPDGQWLMFSDCMPGLDPAHHFADIAVCRPDGSGFRRLTEGRNCYFATSFGLEGYRMGGSNCPIWTPDSKIIYSPMLPDSHPDCHFDGSQRSHEELIYDPSMGRGGCGLSLLDPATGESIVITPAEEGSWDFRPRLHESGKLLLYTHSEFGHASEIRLLDLDTGDIRIITNGTDGLGADHPAFLF